MNSQNALNLIKGATEDGDIGKASMMVLKVPDMGVAIQAGLGITVDAVQSSEVFLLSLLIDDSGSIRFAGNAGNVRDGTNLVFDALEQSRTGDDVLVHTRYLNQKILDEFKPLTQATRLTSQNYDPTGSTPLYDETTVILGTVISKTQEFKTAGVPVRSVTVIVTDGGDTGGPRGQTARTVKPIVTDMLKSENHLIFFIGIDDGSTDFRAVAREMGIPDNCVLTPKNTPHEIRAAFLTASRSAVRESQGAVGFSKAAQQGLGGFTT